MSGEKTLNALGAAFLSILPGMGTFFFRSQARRDISGLCSRDDRHFQVFLANRMVVLYSVCHFRRIRCVCIRKTRERPVLMNRQKLWVGRSVWEWRLTNWWMRLGLLGLLCFLGEGTPVWANEATLYVTDALTIPSQSVQLQARLTEGEGRKARGLPDEELEFLVQGRPVGRGTTDEDGWARIDFTPSKMRGNLQVLVKRITAVKAEAIQAKGQLLSWERRRPILLIDLAVLVKPGIGNEPSLPEMDSNAGVFTGTPQEGASLELGKLAQYYYNLIYLDLTGKQELEAIQVWLRKHQFPPGRIHILPRNPSALSDVLEQLHDEGWENVSGGIGHTAKFAEVLVKNRLQAVILTDSDKKGEFPRRTILLPDWSRVRRYL